MKEYPTFVTHLECSYTGKLYQADKLHGLSEDGKPLLVRYDLEKLSASVTKEALNARLPEFWRYREFLPVRRSENIVRLGEIMTPLLPATNLQQEWGSGEILIKDEGRLPTGSFKARGLALAVAMAKELGVERMAMPTNGNAGAALAASGLSSALAGAFLAAAALAGAGAFSALGFTAAGLAPEATIFSTINSVRA